MYHVAEIGFELTFLFLPSAGITGRHHHTWLFLKHFKLFIESSEEKESCEKWKTWAWVLNQDIRDAKNKTKTKTPEVKEKRDYENYKDTGTIFSHVQH